MSPTNPFVRHPTDTPKSELPTGTGGQELNPLTIIVGVVAFMALQEMAMLDNMDELGAVFSHAARGDGT